MLGSEGVASFPGSNLENSPLQLDEIRLGIDIVDVSDSHSNESLKISHSSDDIESRVAVLHPPPILRTNYPVLSVPDELLTFQDYARKEITERNAFSYRLGQVGRGDELDSEAKSVRHTRVLFSVSLSLSASHCKVPTSTERDYTSTVRYSQLSYHHSY